MRLPAPPVDKRAGCAGGSRLPSSHIGFGVGGFGSWLSGITTRGECVSLVAAPNYPIPAIRHHHGTRMALSTKRCKVTLQSAPRFRREGPAPPPPRPRRIPATAVRLLRAHGRDNIDILDGLEVLGHDAAGMLHDGLHPNPEGYRLMASRIAPAMAKSLNPSAMAD